MMDTIEVKDLVECARSLIDKSNDSEYARGMVDLIAAATGVDSEIAELLVTVE